MFLDPSPIVPLLLSIFLPDTDLWTVQLFRDQRRAHQRVLNYVVISPQKPMIFIATYQLYCACWLACLPKIVVDEHSPHDDLNWA